MALIGEIITKIKVDASQQKKGLSQAKKGYIKFGKVADKVNKGLKAGIVGLTGALLGFSAAMIKSTTDVDNLAKTASKLGIATGELQKLRFQAEQTGVSTKTLDMALQRMVRRVAEASQGTGEAVKALKELGLNAQFLAKQSPDKQFTLISEAMKKVGNQTDKVRLAFKLFDSEGVALVNTLNSNLKESGNLFDKLGISLTQLDTKKVEKFNDTWNQTTTILKGVRDKIWVGLSEALTKVLGRFNDFLKAGGTGKLINGFLGGIDSMIKQFQRVREGIKFMRADFTDLFESMAGSLAKAQMAMSSFIEKTIGLYQRLKISIGDVLETASSVDVKGVFAGKPSEAGKNLFADPLKGLLDPTNVPTGGSQKGELTIKLKADTGLIVDDVIADPKTQAMYQQFLIEETAKLGR